MLGYTRSFGMRVPNGERYEFVKPIMFSAGVGSLNDLHCYKQDPEPGMYRQLLLCYYLSDYDDHIASLTCCSSM